VPGASKIINKDGLQSILDEETQWAKEANRERDEARKNVERKDKIVEVLNVVSIILAFVWIFLIILFYIKFDRELKPRFAGKYYRDIPSDITPAEVSYLMSFGNVNPNDITATLLDLVQRGYLKLESVAIQKKKLFGAKEIPTYQFSFTDSPPSKLLKAHEIKLINWFIGEVGENGRVTLEDIKDEAKGRTSGLSFKRDYDLWVMEAKKEGQANGFLDRKASKKGIIIGVLTGLFYFAWGFLVGSQHGGSSAAVLLSILGVVMFLYSVRIKKRTAYGAEEHSKWKALKRFLLNFSRMDKKDIPELILWEKYLVYAVSFGIAKKVMRQLPLVFNENEFRRNDLAYLYMIGYGHHGFNRFTDMMDTTISAVNNAVSTSRSVASSKNSSGFGGGGGFSGGGGGGGGGGGRGAF
jgi:uncharacterized membrane protein